MPRVQDRLSEEKAMHVKRSEISSRSISWRMCLRVSENGPWHYFGFILLDKMRWLNKHILHFRICLPVVRTTIHACNRTITDRMIIHEISCLQDGIFCITIKALRFIRLDSSYLLWICVQSMYNLEFHMCLPVAESWNLRSHCADCVTDLLCLWGDNLIRYCSPDLLALPKWVFSFAYAEVIRR